MQALSALGAKVVLKTFEKPDPKLLEETFGDNVKCVLHKVVTLNLLSSLVHPSRKSGSKIHINTHGDMLPFFRDDFSKENSFVYCHYPIAGCLIDSNNKDYKDLLYGVSMSQIAPSKRDLFFDMAREAYKKMIINSTTLTNSEFSRKAIFKMFGVNSTVIYPPVNTELFRNAAFSSKATRVNDILVISRFHRSKKIENAVQLARLLRRRGIGRRMVIVGNVSPDGAEYYDYLRKLTKDCGVEDFVKFEPSVNFDRLVELMSTSKVYLHPLPGEPFGISTVESMSAGLIPVVADIGGHTEFVPRTYQFHTFGEGADAVAAALDASSSEHLWMSHRAEAFSVANFVAKFKNIVSKAILPAEQQAIAPQPMVSSSPSSSKKLLPTESIA